MFCITEVNHYPEAKQQPAELEGRNSPRPKKTRQEKSMLIIFFDIKWIVHKEIVPAGQTVNFAYYCYFYGDSVKACEDFAPNFGDKRSGCFITITYHLTLPSSSGTFFFTKNISIPHPPYFSLFLRWKIKLKGRNFDATEMSEADS
jgi:hypothetical protein